MAAEPVDLLVIGGGITGAGIARDAALRGLRTALVDKGDFAGATSSRSSRLIHGGLRYLEQYDFHLVREASRERRLLLDLAPHLVRPLAFLFPVYRGARVPAWRLRAGMWLYDLLAAFRNVRLHRWLGRRAAPRPPPLLRLTKGAHVAVPRGRIGNAHAVTLTSPIDGRVMFVLPWGDLSYVGTTDTDDVAPPDDVRASGSDVVYLLRSANAFFPQARLAPHDVICSWAGLRPLLAPEREVAASAVSREHRIVESASGLITIAGGKLTTFRVMGRDMVDRVARRLHELDGRPIPRRPPTDRVPLPGGETADLAVLVEAARAREVPEPTARHLVQAYGSEAPAVLNLVERDRALGKPIIPGRPEIWAEVRHAVERGVATLGGRAPPRGKPSPPGGRELGAKGGRGGGGEGARGRGDVLGRRPPLSPDPGARPAPATSAVADHLGELLGWDAARRSE